MTQRKPETNTEKNQKAADTQNNKKQPEKIREIGGPEGPEPTRYGDWEVGGRCSDF